MTYTNEIIQNYFRLMREKLSPKRYNHSVGVAHMSANLAYVWDVPADKALVAGILHDNAKEIDDDTLIEMCEYSNVPLTSFERKNTGLIHPKYGAYLAGIMYDINDDDVINAIRNHTVGRINMSRLEQIVFCADFLEPSRTQKCEPSLDELRKLAFTDIDMVTVAILQNVHDYLMSRPETIDPTSLKVLEFYKAKIAARS